MNKESEEKAKLAITMLTDMLGVATEALKYISTSPVMWEPGVVQPRQVSLEALELMRGVSSGAKGAKRKADVIPIKKLKDGEDILFSHDFDCLYHCCCSCKLTHEVILEWLDNGDLKTTWTTVDKVPTRADILAKGGEIIGPH